MFEQWEIDWGGELARIVCLDVSGHSVVAFLPCGCRSGPLWPKGLNFWWSTGTQKSSGRIEGPFEASWMSLGKRNSGFHHLPWGRWLLVSVPCSKENSEWGTGRPGKEKTLASEAPLTASHGDIIFFFLASVISTFNSAWKHYIMSVLWKWHRSLWRMTYSVLWNENYVHFASIQNQA